MTTINGLQVPQSLNPIIDYSTPSSGGSTYTLPTGANILAGQRVKIVNGGTGSILVNGSDATLVRTVYPGTSGEVMALQNNPTNQAHWAGLDNIVSDWFSYTPGAGSGFGTATVAVGSWRRVGGSAEYVARIVSGSVTGNPCAVGLLSGHTIDTSRIIYNTTVAVGVNGCKVGEFDSDNTTANGPVGGVLTGTSSSVVSVFLGGGSAGGISGGNTALRFAAGNVFQNTTEFQLRWLVPIVGWTATRG